jgi:hypothetical protein
MNQRNTCRLLRGSIAESQSKSAIAAYDLAIAVDNIPAARATRTELAVELWRLAGLL